LHRDHGPLGADKREDLTLDLGLAPARSNRLGDGRLWPTPTRTACRDDGEPVVAGGEG